jgi:hypothetical protein
VDNPRYALMDSTSVALVARQMRDLERGRQLGDDGGGLHY